MDTQGTLSLVGEELETAITKLKDGKTPAPDGVPLEVVKFLAKEYPQETLGLLNSLYAEITFPEGRIVNGWVVIATQRKAALRIARAYKTISTEAELVIAGVIPMDLLAEERTRLYRLEDRTKGQNEAVRRETVRQVAKKAEGGHRKHGDVTYQLCQMLTGHGNFSVYLKRISKIDDERCIYCGAKRTVFQCSRWDGERRTLELGLGSRNNERNLIPLDLENRENWTSVATYVDRLMTVKEGDFRAKGM
ncbi:hypothetical protein NQ315_009190 [Exocentrus adspersus]|uniref:Uncharacterized protein n=1 Tax=Exocentrus adspersus TaxID=1586481 RepID=A0AAV8WF39_9CUCU|nr:hypothetical protein NQ315_009190 [Exocentrus adspersus]